MHHLRAVVMTVMLLSCQAPSSEQTTIQPKPHPSIESSSSATSAPSGTASVTAASSATQAGPPSNLTFLHPGDLIECGPTPINEFAETGDRFRGYVSKLGSGDWIEIAITESSERAYGHPNVWRRKAIPPIWLRAGTYCPTISVISGEK